MAMNGKSLLASSRIDKIAFLAKTIKISDDEIVKAQQPTIVQLELSNMLEIRNNCFIIKYFSLLYRVTVISIQPSRWLKSFCNYW